MKLSVIVLTFNSEKYISGCIESIYAANTKEEDFEILVVDNGSNDNTIDLISKNKNCKILNFPNSTMGMARNHGLSHAKGKYISFLDCDDRYTKNRFLRHLNILDENDNIDNVIGVCKLFFKEENKYGYKKFTLENKLNINDYLDGKCYSLCGITYRKKFLNQNKIKFEDGIRGRYGEDWYFQTICETKNQYSYIDYNDSAIIQIRKDSHTQIDLQRKAKCLNLIRLLELNNSGIKLKFWSLFKYSLKYNLSKVFNEKSEFDNILEKNLKKFSRKNLIKGILIKIALKKLHFNKKLVVFLWDLKSRISFKKY